MTLRHGILLCLLFAAFANAAPSSKLQSKLIASLKSKNLVNVIIKFQEKTTAALHPATNFETREARINAIVENLKSLSYSSQQEAIGLIKSQSPFSTYKQFWISNELYVKGADVLIINQLASLANVEEIREEHIISLDHLEKDVKRQVEWNIERIEAPGAWQLDGGNNGTGAVVASIDTGVRRTHEALRDTYRESYGWFDPYGDLDSPSDRNGIGTHIMGVIVGSGGIGVAPGAKWISCRGCSSSSCTEAALLACGQWIACPTLVDGSSPDCAQAPHVVNNVWGGGQGSDWYNGVIQAWNAVGIVPVFAVGASGPQCGTIGSPADQPGVIGVGATLSDDSVSTFASKGPALDGSIKPDLVAPGAQIRSAFNTDDNAYAVLGGTSMATAHVSGTVALLKANDPDLTTNQVWQLLVSNTSTDLPETGVVCGGIPSTEFPNNEYGYGLLNARKALEAAIAV